MNISKMLLSATIAVSIGLTSCGPKDADIQKSLQEKAAPGVTVTVKDGVVTLSGEVKEEAAKTAAEGITKDVKGVKSTVNNITVAAPPPPPAQAEVTISADDPLSKAVVDATKDFPGITATVKEGVIAVTGEISADKWKKLKMMLDALKPKKVDGSALKIK